MRLSNLFSFGTSGREDDAAGVTIDVMTGIVAGIALVLAILILASSLRHAQAVTPAGGLGMEQSVPHA